jgi:hypothetical protein
MTQNLPEKQTQNNQIVEKSRNEGLIPHEQKEERIRFQGKMHPRQNKSSYGLMNKQYLSNIRSRKKR